MKYENSVEKQVMHDLAKMFIHCLNNWTLDTPSARKEQGYSGEEIFAYKSNYSRYESYCLILGYAWQKMIDPDWLGVVNNAAAVIELIQ